MDVGFRLEQQQQLKLVMTPELRQAITILQFSAIDLSQFLREQANENPLIEIEEPEITNVETYLAQLEQKKLLHIGWDEAENGSYTDFSIAAEDYVNPIEFYRESQVTLHEYLNEQIRYLHLDQQQKKLLIFLIGNVDENGYLNVSEDMLPQDFGVSPEQLEQGIALLQQLEPYGVGARDLQECLLIQLRYVPWSDELSERIISNHLSDLAAKRYKKIAALEQVTVMEVQQVADYIKGLHPKPGVFFHSHHERFIIPDVSVERLSKGKYAIQVNDSILPRIHLNKEYTDLYQQQGEVKSFLEERFNQLNWLLKSLDQRKQTLLKVTEAIVEEQEEFFERGESFLQPLTLKDIAQKINVHESTVSRATNQKYVQTPFGVFELKYFFVNKVAVKAGEDTSVTKVKQLIKKMIEGEDSAKPLSDQKLVQLLADQGIRLARRTVAKYRDELGILSSAQRKRYE